MRLCLCLLLIFNLDLCAVGTAQQKRVSLKLENATARELFHEIQRQTGYYFVFNDAQSDRLGLFTVDARDRRVDELLDELLDSRGCSCSFEDGIIVLKPARTMTEEKKALTVSGTVKDVEGRPVPGVTVRATRNGKGGLLGQTTDAEGRFRMVLPGIYREDLILVFSFIGMETQHVRFTGKTEFNIVMLEDRKELEEVVVTGYQVIDKRQLTSAIETVKAEDLDKVGALTVDEMLEGKAAGLMVTNLSSTPGAAAKIRVRSGATFTGSRAPLWVVDGIIYEDPVPLSADDINSFDRVNLIGNALTGLNPQDIESINILKDASATAIYGTRAANGVIVVTTKRGRKGKAGINYSGSFNVVNRPHYTDFNLMDSRERVDVSREIAEKNLGYPEDIFTWVGYEKVMRDYRLGRISFDGFKRQVGEIETMNTDWFDELYRPALTTSQTVNLSGGTDNMRYYFSIGYNYNEGTEKGVGLNRITARSNVDVNLRKDLIISLSMSGSVQEADYNHSSVNLFDQAYYNSRAIPFRNPDGSLFFIEERLREQNNRINKVGYNVMNEMQQSAKTISNKDFNINAQLNWTLVKGIRLMASASYRNTTNLQEEWITDKTHYIAKLRTYDKVEDLVKEWEKKYSEVPFGGIYTGGMTSQRSLRGQLQLNFSKVIAAKHVFNLNLGYEANSNKYTGSNGWTAPGYNHEQGRGFIRIPSYYANVDIPGKGWDNYDYVNMMKWLTGQGAMDIYPTVMDRLSNSLSAFGIFNYSYDNRYIFNFNMRSDGSNRFGQYTRYKFKPTWSVSGRWNIHNEHFWNASGKVDELGLRLSYGFRGTPPSTTPYMVIRNYVYNPEFKENGARMDNFPNANLSWEKSSTLNAGLNYSLFGGRINGAIDFAYSHGTDLLLSRPVSLVNGQATQLYNGGEKKDYSYELSINATVIKQKDWGWRIGANATMTREEILAGFEAERTMLNVEDYLNGSIYLTGFPVDAFYSYRFDGLDSQGLPRFKNLENYSPNLFDLMKDVLTYSGRRTPKVYGGFNTEIRYRRLTLRSSFSYKAGHHTRMLALFNGKKSLPMPHENMRGEFNSRWRQPGDEAWAVVPGLSNEDMHIGTNHGNHFQVASSKIVPTGATGYTLYDKSDLRVARAGHIRWSTLSLNYNFPERFLKPIGMNTLRLSAQVSNLAVWSFDKKLDGQDPEQVQGIGMPALPSYSLSLSFGF